MYNHEFTESKHKVNRENDEMSKEDLNFLQVLDNDAHYKLPLPLRDDISDCQIADHKLR